MPNCNIENAIHDYLNQEKTDYAIMISGEWGVGKTYYIKNSIIPFLHKNKQREVYVSLIGVSSDEVLERKVFSKINPFYSCEKSAIARESEYLESLIEKGEQKNKIPNNVVLIFDDLERIDPLYFESAMGFINTHIEHNNIKCIFLCNEKRLLENTYSESENYIHTGIGKIYDYNLIKEKYIRFTYKFRKDFRSIIQSNALEIKEDVSIDIDEIHKVFRKGECYNLRTLFYAFSIFEGVLQKLDFSYKFVSQAVKNEVLQLLFNYICFYTIEYKNKGTSQRTLSQITTVFSDVMLKDVISSEKKDKNEIKDIQLKYFRNEAINFYYFESIGIYIVNGYLVENRLQADLTQALDFIKDKQLQEIKKQIKNIFVLKNDEYVSVITKLVQYAENGRLDLISYVSLYQALIQLKNYNLFAESDLNYMKGKIISGLDQAFKNRQLNHISQLASQINVTYPSDEERFDLNNFKQFVININDKIRDENSISKIGDVLGYIQNENKHNLYAVLSDKESLLLESTYAKDIFSTLISADTDVIEAFSNALHKRYRVRMSDNTHSPTRENEIDFISDLYSLLLNAPFLKNGAIDKMSHVQLLFLKKNLLKYIKNVH